MTMRIEDVSIADGKVESVHTSMATSEVIFLDWQEVKWRLLFNDVLAVENLNIEGEELDRIEVSMDDPYIQRVRSLVDEPDATVALYGFFTPWKDEARLRVIAGSCNVEVLADLTAATNDTIGREKR